MSNLFYDCRKDFQTDEKVGSIREVFHIYSPDNKPEEYLSKEAVRDIIDEVQLRFRHHMTVPSVKDFLLVNSAISSQLRTLIREVVNKRHLKHSVKV